MTPSLRSPRSLSTLVVLSLLAPALAAASPTEVCAPLPNWGNEPRWWTPAGKDHERIRVEGEWGGAGQLAYGSGTAIGRFRVATVGQNVFFSFQRDQAIGTRGARLYLGIAPIGATDLTAAKVYRIHLTGGGIGQAIACHGAPAAAGQPGEQCLASPTAGVKKFLWSAANNDLRESATATAALVGTLATQTWWEESSLAWADALGITIDLRIPLAELGGAAAATEFKMWFEYRNCPATSNPDDGASCANDIRFPVGIPTLAGELDVAGERVLTTLPAITEWGTLRTNMACGGGLDIDYSMMGSMHIATPSGAVDECQTFVQAKTLTWNDTKFMGSGRNCLLARPVNRGPDVLPNKLTAEFFLASWGSQDPFDLALAQWEPVGSASSPPAAPDIPVNGTVDLTIPFDLNKTIRCKYSSAAPAIPGDCTSAAVNASNPDDPAYHAACCAGVPEAWTRKRHQCMQVRLSSAQAMTFQRDSALMNMDFVPASRFWRLATVGTKSVTPRADGTRVVYLYARARNLPAEAEGEAQVPAAESARRLEEYLRKYGQGGAGDVLRRQLADILERGNVARNPQGHGDVPPETVQRGVLDTFRRLPTEVLREVVPTLEVHAYRETQVKVKDGAELVTILDPQPGFGYYVEHAGTKPLVGWSVELDGAEALGDGWFRVTTRGDEALVRTRIQAIEAAEPPQLPSIVQWPPEKYWLHGRGKVGAPGAVTVKPGRGGVCAVGDDAGSGTAGLALVLGAALWATRVRRRRRPAATARRASAAR